MNHVNHPDIVSAALEFQRSREQFMSLLGPVSPSVMDVVLSAIVGQPSQTPSTSTPSQLPEAATVEGRILHLLQASPDGMRSEQIRDTLKVHREVMPKLLSSLLASGAVQKHGERRATVYTVGTIRKASTVRSARMRRTGGGGGSSYEEAILLYLKDHPNSTAKDMNGAIRHPNLSNFSTILSSLKGRGVLDRSNERPAKWFVAKGHAKNAAVKAPKTPDRFLNRVDVQKALKVLDKLESSFSTQDLAHKMRTPVSHLSFVIGGLKSHGYIKPGQEKGQWIRSEKSADIQPDAPSASAAAN